MTAIDSLLDAIRALLTSGTLALLLISIAVLVLLIALLGWSWVREVGKAESAFDTASRRRYDEHQALMVDHRSCPPGSPCRGRRP